MIAPHEIPIPGPAAAFAAALQARVPRIETARLILRGPRLEGFDCYAEIAISPRGRFLGQLETRDEAWLDFTQMTASWLLRGHGLWAVETQAEGALVGFVVLGFELGDDEPELGYMLRPAAEGHGYAAEAARAARAYAFGTAGLPGLVSMIDRGNAASIRLAERLGAKRDPAAEDARGCAVLVYRH